MQIEAEVIKALASAKSKGNTVVLEGKMDRKLYTKVDEVLQAAGFNWNRKAKAHVHERADVDAEETIDRIVVAGEIEVASDIGFFPTPEDLAQRLVVAAEVAAGHLVLEPSCGNGRIVDAILAAGGKVTVCERVTAMRDRMIERLATESALLEVMMDDDFMDVEPHEEFDRVVMNPPFRKVGKGDHLDHVIHAFKMLKSGGILVSVLPAGIDFREDRRHREVRDLILAHGSIEALPAGSFKESGTGVNTVMIKMVKP